MAASSAFQATLLATLLLFILGDDHKRLITLEREIFNWRLEDRPEFASLIGVYRHSDRLERYTFDFMTIRYEIGSNYLQRLRNINVTNLSKRDRVDHAILEDMLQTFVYGFEWRNWNYLTPMTWLEGQQRDPYYFVELTPFDNRGDFENYITRLKLMPQLFKEYTTLFKEAIRLNRTAHYVTMWRVPEQIEFIMESEVEDSIYFSPFIHDLGKDYFTSTISNPERQEIILRGKKATTAVFEAYKTLNTFLKDVYMKHTRPGVGVGSLQGGQDYYKACLKWYLSLDVTPEEIHRTGNEEVSRVKNEMKKIMTNQGYGGYQIRDYFVELKNRTEMFFETEAEIIAEYEKMILERIEPHLSKLFHDPPGLPIKVEVMRSDGSRGQYAAGTPDGIRPGVFFVNTFRKWPKYTMISTAMHETNPGHHLQMSYAATADLHEFRKTKEYSDITRVPFAFPSYTAYVEGWALYAESLGIETKIYKDDYERMGYYEAEMWRACRMVADTGLHHFGWTRDQAINFIMEHTSETKEGIEVEVDRYITWPGQAVSYKIGELKIQELRKYSEKRLGENFDIRDFHKVVLENGGMPLNLLSTVVKEWVDAVLNGHHEEEESDEKEEGEGEEGDCGCSTKGRSRCSRSTGKNIRNGAGAATTTSGLSIAAWPSRNWGAGGHFVCLLFSCVVVSWLQKALDWLLVL